MNRREFLVAGAATVAGLAASARAGGGDGRGTPAALVTADLQSHVVAVALGTGRVLRRVQTLEGPRAIEGVLGRWVVVCHTDEGALTILSGRRLELSGTIGGLVNPRYVAPHPSLPLAYVTDSGSGELLTVDVTRARLLARTELGGPARHVSILPDGSAVWAVLGSAADRVAICDTRRSLEPRLARTIRTPYPAHDVVISPDGRRAWVTSGEERVLGIYDTAGRRLLRRLDADAAPQHVTFAADRRRAYVASGDDGSMRTYELDRLRLERTARVPVGSYNLTVSGGGGGRVFTPSLSQGTLTVLDRQGRVVREATIAESAHDATFVVVG